MYYLGDHIRGSVTSTLEGCGRTRVWMPSVSPESPGDPMGGVVGVSPMPPTGAIMRLLGMSISIVCWWPWGREH